MKRLYIELTGSVSPESWRSRINELLGSVRRTGTELAVWRFIMAGITALVLEGFDSPAATAVEPSPTPICTVRREVYISSPEPGAATSAKRVTYVGNGLRRREFLMTTRRSDISDTIKVRFSEDNGRTWSEPEALAATEELEQNGNHLVELVNATKYDPVAKKTVEFIYQAIYLGEVEALMNRNLAGQGKKLYHHAFYRVSDDHGHRWSERKLLKFEPGADFNPQNWADPNFLEHNEVCGTYEAYVLADGRLAYPAVVYVPYREDEEDRRVCGKLPWYDSQPGFVAGAACFFGTWNASQNDYDWTRSNPVTVPRRVSTRGLSEPMLAEFQDGTLMLDMRGSNKGLDYRKYPVRRLISLSNDRGKTWSDVRDLRFDDGEPFYSPAAHSRLLRSSKTGKLYWLGNISSRPQKGNGDRYPLYIAEIDEQLAALKKSTLTVIDDRGPTDSTALQLSNFSALENRETQDIELFLTRYGENSDNIYTANAYKYTLTLH